MDYKKLIEERKSVRNFKDTEVPANVIDEILDYPNKNNKLIQDIETKIIVKNKNETYENLKNVAGYEGIMIEAPHYLIILSEKDDYYLENTGYLGESIVLQALYLGVNSCWITFPSSHIIKEKLNINNSKEVTAIIAIGYDDKKKRAVNTNEVGDNYTKSKLKIIKNNTSYRTKIEEIVYLDTWGNKLNSNELEHRGILDAINYARLAPSTMNRQPWRFIIDDDKIILTIKKENNISEYEEKIDTGISLLYFKLIIEQTLLDVKWILEKPKNDYNVPDEYKTVGYCKI